MIISILPATRDLLDLVLINITQSVKSGDNLNFVHSECDGIILWNFTKKKVPRCLVKTVMDPNDHKLRKYMGKEFNTQWN